MARGRTSPQDSARRGPAATTPRTSPSSRASRRCASGPGMYIGSTGMRGLHHLVYEVVDNSVDEALAGHCTRVDVTIHPDSSVTVDRQRPRHPRRRSWRRRAGRPSRSCSRSCTPAASSATAAATRSPGGLHGVGVSVVNALSESLTSRSAATATSGPRTTSAASRRAPLQKGASRRRQTGTTITFLPDADDLRDARLRLRDPRAAPARDGLPHPRPADLARRRARRGPAGRVPVRRRHRGLRRATSTRTRTRSRRRSSSSRASERRGRRRGRACSGTPPTRSRLLVRQQHQHARGRLAPLRLPLGADAHAQQVRARQGPAQGEGRQPLGRGRARGPDRRHLGQARATRSSRARRRPSSATRAWRASSSRSSTRGSPSSSRRTRRRRARIIRKAVQASQARAAARKARDLTRRKSRARELAPAGQARRLLGQGPGAGRDLRRRGRLRRRLGQAGPRPQHAGGAAAARQDPQRREERGSTRCCRTTRSRR